MSGPEESPQRVTAGVYLTHAKTHMVKGRVDRALDEARLAIEADPTFDEVHCFLAEVYERLGETRKAVHQYEELLLNHPHDQELLVHLERLDPLTAAKYRRLAEIAPDPFVSGGRLAAAGEDDLADMGYIDLPAGGGQPSLAVVPEGPTELVDMEAVSPVEQTPPPRPELHVEAGVLDEEEIGALAPPTLQPAQYEYEDERQVRDSVAALPPVRELLGRQRGMWAARELLDDLLAQTRPLTCTENEEAANAFSYAASLLGANTTVPCVITDPSLWPLICGPLAAYVVIPTGALEALGATELYFLAGRALSRVACHQVELLDVIAAVLPASRPSSRLIDIQREVAARAMGGPSALADPAHRAQLQGRLHAWRLRAELTADRAGLVCCQSPEDAASAIARLTAANAAAAQALSPEALEHRFGGRDLGQIAALALDHDPATSESYAYYRIRMLKWWSTQPAYAKLVAPPQ